MSRYIIKEDSQHEQFKIVDTGRVLGSEDFVYVWFATAYERVDAEHICRLLNKTPHAPISKPEGSRPKKEP